MSGTAYRKDSKGIMLSACTGKVIYRKKASALQKEEFLAPSIIRFVQSPPPSHVTLPELIKMAKEDVYMNAIVLNEPRNKLLFRFLSEFKDESIAISVRLIEHGEILSALTGIPFLNGKSSTKERKVIRDGLKSGEIKRVIGTSLIDQSVDFPLLKVFLNWAGYSPRVAQIQRLGRILRLSQGKTAYFIDLVDSWNSKMLRHSKQRISFMRKESLDVQVEKYNGKQFENEFESITNVII
jgi:superfamily II DNA or RNA helicase